MPSSPDQTPALSFVPLPLSFRLSPPMRTPSPVFMYIDEFPISVPSSPINIDDFDDFYFDDDDYDNESYLRKCEKII